MGLQTKLVFVVIVIILGAIGLIHQWKYVSIDFNLRSKTHRAWIPPHSNQSWRSGKPKGYFDHGVQDRERENSRNLAEREDLQLENIIGENFGIRRKESEWKDKRDDFELTWEEENERDLNMRQQTIQDTSDDEGEDEGKHENHRVNGINIRQQGQNLHLRGLHNIQNTPEHESQDTENTEHGRNLHLQTNIHDMIQLIQDATDKILTATRNRKQQVDDNDTNSAVNVQLQIKTQKSLDNRRERDITEKEIVRSQAITNPSDNAEDRTETRGTNDADNTALSLPKLDAQAISTTVPSKTVRITADYIEDEQQESDKDNGVSSNSVASFSMELRQRRESQWMSVVQSGEEEASEDKKQKDIDSEGSMRECRSTERLHTVRQYCDAHPWIDNSTSLTFKTLAKRIWVDDVNKVLMCTHAKAGSSTWKMILANNTSDKPVDETAMGHIMIHGAMNRFGLKLLNRYNETEIKERLMNYYKFMVVRHPYDRLQSFFKDKFVEKSQWNRTLGIKLMKKYHPELPWSTTRRGNVSFSDWIRWVEAGHDNEHWRGPYHGDCHPCLIPYDRIVKLETQDSDSKYIIMKKLRGRGYGTARNQNDSHKHVMLTTGKDLYMFNNCTSSQMDFLRQRLDVDLQMFGYRFDETTYNAKCGYGDKCC